TIQLASQTLQQTDAAQPITSQQIVDGLISTAPHYGASGTIQHEQNAYGLNQQSYGHKDHLDAFQQQHQLENHQQSVIPEETATQINIDLQKNPTTQGVTENIQLSEATPVTADSQPSHQDRHDSVSTSHQQSPDHHPSGSTA
ncbi:unnamed protein product, partial [Callosobruchus maculatus]